MGLGLLDQTRATIKSNPMDQASFFERIPKKQYLIMGLMCVCQGCIELELEWE